MEEESKEQDKGYLSEDLKTLNFVVSNEDIQLILPMDCL